MRQIADPDLWGRLSVGAIVFESGHLPRLDDFSYSARGAPWIDHEWLSGVLFYAVLRVGEPALLLLKYALAAAALALAFALYGRPLRDGLEVPPALAGVALIALSPVALVGFAPTLRSQLFSFPLFLATLVLLESVRSGRASPRRLGWTVPLFVFWANCHGGFVMGLLAMALYALALALEARSREAMAVGVAALLGVGAVAVANPYGMAYLGFLVDAWTFDRSGVVEWLPLFDAPLTAKRLLAWALLAASGGLASIGLFRVPLRAVSLVLWLLVAMTLISLRIQPFLVLAFVFYLPLFATELAGARLPSPGVTRAARVACAAAGLAAVVATAWLGRPVLSTIVPDERARGAPVRFVYPAGVVRLLEALPSSGRLLNPFSQGEFLYWALYPRYRVAIDGRFEEVYTREQFERVGRFYHQHLAGAPEAVRQFAARSGADYVLFRSRWRNAAVLAADPGWRRIYDDGAFALVARVEVLDRMNDEGVLVLPPPPARPLTIRDYFTDADRARFRQYPAAPPGGVESEISTGG